MFCSLWIFAFILISELILPGVFTSIIFLLTPSSVSQLSISFPHPLFVILVSSVITLTSRFIQKITGANSHTEKKETFSWEEEKGGRSFSILKEVVNYLANSVSIVLTIVAAVIQIYPEHKSRRVFFLLFFQICMFYEKRGKYKKYLRFLYKCSFYLWYACVYAHVCVDACGCQITWSWSYRCLSTT